MKLKPIAWLSRPDTIRLRLSGALALALLPVLILSGLQAALAFQGQAQGQRAELVAAALRSGAAARTRIESAQAILQTLGPSSTSPQCAQQLAEAAKRLQGYENLIRLGADGAVVCAASAAPSDSARVQRPWFQALERRQPVVLTATPGVAYSADPSLIAAIPEVGADGSFQGALVAVMSLASLKPQTALDVPAGAEIAFADAQGRWLSASHPERFPTSLSAHLPDVTKAGSTLWLQTDLTGGERIYAAAPLVGADVFVAISAPPKGLLSWARLNPISAVALPLLAFVLALIAVLIATERSIVRWIAYLQRIASIYARGRFTVRPVRASGAPPEIRDLAETLDSMAAAIAARDAALTEHLAQKDQLLLEIHHRVKNNLQVISSLLNIQQRALEDPAARAAIADTRQRIAALALIYRTLYQGPDLRRVDLREFLEELMGMLVTGENGQAPLVRTEFACDPLIVDPDRLAPIALFAVEAVSNARKHGLDDGGRLTVTFSVRAAEAELAISDTGVGGETAVVGKGVGRTLMTAHARQLRGVARFEANKDGGLTASLTFPLPEAPAGQIDPPAAAEAAPPPELSRAAAR